MRARRPISSQSSCRVAPCPARCGATRRRSGPPGPLVRREVTCGQGEQVVGLGRWITGRHDHRDHELTPFVGRFAHHRDLGDAGVREQHVLDLARVHVEAARDDELLGSPDDAEVAVVIELADVAAAEPSVGVERVAGRVVPVPVAGEHVRSAEQDLARRPSARRTSTPGSGKPTVPGTPLAVVGIRHVHDRLGHAVALQHAHARARANSSSCNDGGNGADPDTQSRSTASSATRGDAARRAYMVGHAEEERRVVRTRRVEHRVGVEPRERAPPTRRRGACRAARRRGRARGTTGARAPGGRRRSTARRGATPRSSPVCCRA